MNSDGLEIDNQVEAQQKINLMLPDKQINDIQNITPYYYNEALEHVTNSKIQLQSVADKLKDRLKYFSSEVENHLIKVRGNIKEKITELKEQKQNMKMDTSVLPKLESLREELIVKNSALNVRKLELQLDADANVATILNHKSKISRLVEQLNIDILKNYEPPQPNNNNNYIYNWILGCLYNSRHNIIEYCDLNNILDIQSTIEVKQEYKSPVKNSGGMSIICCGGHNRSENIPTVQPSKTDNKWRAFIHQIFLHSDYQIKPLRHQLQQLLPQSFTPLQEMLNEELVNEKNNILKAIYEIDVKEQIRILITIAEIAQEIYRLTQTGEWTQNQQAKSLILKQQTQNNINIKQLEELIQTNKMKEYIIQSFRAQIDNAIQQLQDTQQLILKRIEQNKQPEQEIKLLLEQLQHHEAMERVNTLNKLVKLEYEEIPDEKQPIFKPITDNPHLVSSEIEDNDNLQITDDRHYDDKYHTIITSQNPTASNIWRTLFPNSNKTTQKKDNKGQIFLESGQK